MLARPLFATTNEWRNVSAALRECSGTPLPALVAPVRGTSPSGSALFSAKAESIDRSSFPVQLNVALGTEGDMTLAKAGDLGDASDASAEVVHRQQQGVVAPSAPQITR